MEAIEEANRTLNLLSGITRHDIQNQIAFTGDYESPGVRAPEWQNVREVTERVSQSALSD